MRRLENLTPGEMHVDLYGSETRRFKVLRIGSAMSLSRLLPILQRMGVEVLDEYPYEIRRADGQEAWVLDFGLALPVGDVVGDSTLSERFEDAFRAAWNGECEVDEFNALIVRAGLTWKQAALMRAYSRYMRQMGTTFGQDYIEQVVCANAPITVLLVKLFEIQFGEGVVEREVNADALVFEIESRLDAVVSLDHDRILRAFLGLIRATLRTSYFCLSEIVAHWPSNSTRPRFPICPYLDRSSRSGSTRRESRACTCASASWLAVVCAGVIAARTSAPRSSAW